LVAVVVHPLVPRPGSRQWAIGFVVAAPQPCIVESTRLWIRPAGADRIGKADFPHHARMNLMLAVEVDAFPVDEALAAPGRRDSQRIVFKQHPVPPARHAPRSIVQGYSDAFVGEVALVADFKRRHEAGAVVHAHPRLDVRRLRPAARSLRQSGEVTLLDFYELPWVVRFQIGFANVVDHVVFLFGNHPRLRRHHAKAVRQRLVHPERIAAVLELPFGKAQRGRHGTHMVLRSVAVGADADVDGLAALDALPIEGADEASMVDVTFVLRQGRRSEERRGGAKLPGAFRPLFGNLYQIARQVEELLPAG
jgi:hypothetical protein